MKRILQFLYGNWYGMPLCWCATGLLSLAVGLAFGGDRRLSALVNAVLFLHVVVMTPLALSAPVVSLCRRGWGQACAQVGAGLLAGLLYLVGLSLVSIAAMFSQANVDTFRSEDQAWRETRITDELPDSLPFSLEREQGDGDQGGSFFGMRVAFPLGKWLGLWPSWRGETRDVSVYRMADGRHLLVFQEGLRDEMLYRVDSAAGAVSAHGYGFWVRLPDGTLSVSGLGRSGTEESPTGMSLTVSTERGKEQVSGTERAAEPYLGCTYLGRLEAPGRLGREENPVFAEALARTKTAGAAWDGMAEHGRFTAELDRLFKADRVAFARFFESDPRWHVRTFRDSGRVERRCVFRVFSSGDESCLVRVLLNGQKPGSKLFAKGRCRDPRAGWYAASRALLAELEKAGRAAE